MVVDKSSRVRVADRNAPEGDGDTRGTFVGSDGASVRMPCVVAEVEMQERERKEERKRKTMGRREMIDRYKNDDDENSKDDDYNLFCFDLVQPSRLDSSPSSCVLSFPAGKNEKCTPRCPNQTSDRNERTGNQWRFSFVSQSKRDFDVIEGDEGAGDVYEGRETKVKNEKV